MGETTSSSTAIGRHRRSAYIQIKTATTMNNAGRGLRVHAPATAATQAPRTMMTMVSPGIEPISASLVDVEDR